MQTTIEPNHQNNLFHFHPTIFSLSAISFLIGFALAVLFPAFSPVGVSIAGLAAIFATFTT